MKPILNGKVVALAFLVTLALSALAYALTTSEIWQAWYDAANTAIRVRVVADNS